jgi:hypothetical protein
MAGISFSRSVLVVGALVAVGAVHAAGVAPSPEKDPCLAPAIKPGFRGTDLAPVFDGIVKIPERDQYESTVAFKARRLAAVAALAPVSQCLVEYSGTRFATYDADKQLITFEIRNYGFAGAMDETERYTDYKREDVERHDYVGTNALGVSKQIAAGTQRIRGVLFNGSALRTDMKKLGAKLGKYGEISFVLPAAPDKAKALMPGLSALVAYTWVPDYYQSKVEADSPTLESPYDIKSVYQMLRGKVRRVVLFDDRTGAILYQKALP